MNICPVCNESMWSKIHHISDWDVFQCNNCGFTRIHPLPAPDTRAEFYSENAIQDRSIKKKRGPVKQLAAFIKHYLRKISGRKKGTIFAKQLTHYLHKGDSILDIGCGKGAILSEISNYYECFGVEVSAYLAGEAKKLGVKVFTGDFYNLDFKEMQFDGIIMSSLLEHLHNPAECLQKCHDLLKDKGILLLKTVNHQGVNRRVMGDKWTGYRPPDHMVYFGPKNLNMLLKKIGFSTIKTHASLLNDNFYCEARK